MSEERKTVKIKLTVCVGWKATRDKIVEIDADKWRAMSSKEKNEALEKDIADLGSWRWDEITEGES